MNCRFLLLIAFILLIRTAQAQSPKKLEAEIYTGFQHDSFNWSVAGNSSGTKPNILSELKWKGLKSQAVGMGLNWHLWRSFSLEAHVTQAFTQAGKVSYQDYQGDNRTNITYDGFFDAGRGHLNQYQAQLSYAIRLGKHHIIPYAGYAINNQTLYLLGMVSQTGLDLTSTYQTNRKGLVTGMRATIRTGQHASLEPAFSYNWLDYHSHANWNIIRDFQHPVSFRQNAGGYGVEGSVKARFRLKPYWSVYLQGGYGYWTTDKGTDILYMGNGRTPVTQFNGAATASLSLGGGMVFGF